MKSDHTATRFIVQPVEGVELHTEKKKREKQEEWEWIYLPKFQVKTHENVSKNREKVTLDTDAIYKCTLDFVHLPQIHDADACRCVMLLSVTELVMTGTFFSFLSC